jgi:hypothetical protein
MHSHKASILKINLLIKSKSRSVSYSLQNKSRPIWWYTIKTTDHTSIMLLDIIHHPVYISKHVLETRFCLRLQAKPTQLDPIDRANPYLRTQRQGLALSTEPN